MSLLKRENNTKIVEDLVVGLNLENITKLFSIKDHEHTMGKEQCCNLWDYRGYQ